MVNAPFVSHPLESPVGYRFVEGLIPDLASLFHPVDALLQSPDPVLLTRFLKARGLFHVSGFLRR